MLPVTLFILILFNCHVSAIYEEVPETPSHFISETKLLPEKSDSVKMIREFQNYVPIACFCDRSTCKVNVKPIQSPIIGLLGRDGKIVNSLNIKANQGELMYIILIDSKSIVADGAYFERTSYWRLADGQHQVLPGVPFDYEINPQVSIAILKQSNSNYNFDTDTKNITISALDMSTGLSILPTKESGNKTTYRYLPSKVNRAIGIYQLIHEIVIYPSKSLTIYIANQITGAQCTSLLIMKDKCGFLLLLPSFIQRTSIFRQVAVDLDVKNISRTKADNDQAWNRIGLSKRIIVIISVSSTVAVSIVILVLVLCCCNPCPCAPRGHKPLASEDDDSEELVAMSERQVKPGLTDI